MNLGLGLSICTPRGPGGTFDPASDTLTGWWRTDFSGTPWAGTASAGASGSRNLTDVTGFPPTNGAALNGRIPADFDGVGKRIAASIGVDQFLPAAGAGLAVLFNARSAAADQALFYNAPALFSSVTAARFALTYSTSGIRAGLYNGVDFSCVTPYIACATGGWHWAFCWWDASNLYVQLDNGSPQSHALGGTATPDAFLARVGCNYATAAFFDGRIADIQTRGSAWSAGDMTNRIAYGAARYAL